MPTYQYECDACGFEYEAIQKITANSLKKCPRCKKMKLRRIFGVPGLIFKGEGFYINDYKKKENPPPPEG